MACERLARMTPILPTVPDSARIISGVADDLLGALEGGSGALPAAGSVVVVVVDGLGALQLRSHAGHARHLTAGMGKKDIAYAVFPTTTAAALTSILTGSSPGDHGLVGYQVLDRARDKAVNLLSGWESDGIDPERWQPRPTIFQRAVEAGRAAFAVGLSEYARSGFTRATLRGAEFVAKANPRERVARAYGLAAEHPGSVVYCYLPEADKAGHKHGVNSAEWIAALEEIDQALAAAPPAKVGVLITADHGMVDVPRHRHIILEAGDDRLEGVRLIAGEPRMLHVYADPGCDVDELLATWRSLSAGHADVVSRAEAIAAGLYGASVTPVAAERIGDLLVIARGNRAFYDGRAADQRSQGMIGQHGALTPEERQVPYLRRGAFAL